MEKKKICWKITVECNLDCRFCHRFLNIDNLNYEENKKILNKIINDGITDITWNGGEAMLYPRFQELLKTAKEAGIKNKLITNGILLPKNYKILDYIDSLAISIDTINDEINDKMQRTKEQFKAAKNVLEYTQNLNLELHVNTVISKKNINKINELGEFLNNYNIDKWKFYKFMPLRETAKKNRKEFDISNREFNNIKINLKKFNNIKNFEYKTLKDIEENFIILANGDIIKTTNGKDIKMGNALYDNVVKLIDKNTNNMKKIRTLISYDNNVIRNKIINTIKDLNYIDIIGITSEKTDTLNKIVNLKPELVFSKYNFENKSNLFDIIKESKEALENDIPIFNIISSDIEISNVREIIQEIGDNFNAVIQEDEPLEFRLKSLLEEYRNYKTEL